MINDAKVIKKPGNLTTARSICAMSKTSGAKIRKIPETSLLPGETTKLTYEKTITDAKIRNSGVFRNTPEQLCMKTHPKRGSAFFSQLGVKVYCLQG